MPDFMCGRAAFHSVELTGTIRQFNRVWIISPDDSVIQQHTILLRRWCRNTVRPMLKSVWWKSESQDLPNRHSKNFNRLNFYDPDIEIRDRKSTRLNSSHLVISYAVF